MGVRNTHTQTQINNKIDSYKLIRLTRWDLCGGPKKTVSKWMHPTPLGHLHPEGGCKFRGSILGFFFGSIVQLNASKEKLLECNVGVSVVSVCERGWKRSKVDLNQAVK